MGYLGPVVVRYLRKKYPEGILYGYDTGYFSSCLTSKDAIPERLINTQYFGDMRSFAVPVLDGIDAVVHLAGISNDPIGNRFEQTTLNINHLASIELAKKAKARGVRRFVFASSCSMYGSADDRPRIETDALNPLTAYAKSKVFTERDLKPLAGPDFIVTCLRFSTACGMSDRLRLDLVLNDFVAGAVAEKQITILSDGTPWRPLIAVKDMARAIDWAITRKSSNGGEFLAVNVGADPWNYQVRDLAKAVASVIPGTKISINKDAQPDKRSYRVSFGLFRELAPNHQPQANLVGTIQELQEGLKSLAFDDRDFRKSRLIRLMMLTWLRENGQLDDNLAWKNVD